MFWCKKFAQGWESVVAWTPQDIAARLTLGNVDHLGLELLPHSPYSSDFISSDYHLVGPVKKMLVGDFATDAKLQSAVGGLDSRLIE